MVLGELAAMAVTASDLQSRVQVQITAVVVAAACTARVVQRVQVVQVAAEQAMWRCIKDVHLMARQTRAAAAAVPDTRAAKRGQAMAERAGRELLLCVTRCQVSRRQF